MKYKEFDELLVPLSEELKKYQQKIYIDSDIVRFDLNLEVKQGYLSYRTLDEIIANLKWFIPFSYAPFSFSFSIKDNNGQKNLFEIYRHETEPGWILRKLIK